MTPGAEERLATAALRGVGAEGEIEVRVPEELDEVAVAAAFRAHGAAFTYLTARGTIIVGKGHAAVP